MFERKKHAPPQKRIDCLIGAGTVVRGDVTFTGGPAHRRPRWWATCRRTTASPARW
jgi:hypothetical protein